jgi:LacI family transcriptional regulator
MMLGTTESEGRWEEYYSQSLRARRLDGMILLSGSGKPNVGLVKLADSGSVIFVDESIPGLDAPFISATNRKGARQVAQEMIRFGHRRIAIVAGPAWLWTGQQRLAGYREALAADGRDPDEAPTVHGDYSEASGYQATATLLAGPKRTRPTGIIYANDLMAIGGAQYLTEQKLRIPEDISIVGFDDIVPAQYFSPPLTTVAQPGHAMGEAAAQLLLHHIGLVEAPATISFPTELKVRRSVAAAAG